MEDVIFGGSSNRPSRNIAEVVITLDNSEYAAPAPFNGSDKLKVSRRIERDKGSSYRINGNEVRARDVQLLFADSATGARSTALVSQGRVGAIINAKPRIDAVYWKRLPASPAYTPVGMRLNSDYVGPRPI